MHISITGDLGSGKSTIAKELCKELGYQFLSTGSIQRELARKQGMNTLEFNKYTDQNLHIDDYIDQHLKDINQGTEPYVLDSRLAWFFVPSSFKVFLLTFDEVAAKRILQDKNRVGEPDAASVRQKIADTKERRRIENNRFEKNYGAKFDIYENFDLVVDTSFATVAQLTELILTSYHAWQQKNPYVKIWLSPLRVYPSKELSASRFKIHPLVNSSNSPDFRQLPVIEMFRKGEYFFIHRGYKSWVTAIKNQLPLLPLKLINKTNFSLTASKEIQQISAWEKALNFNYFTYPKAIS